MYPLTLGRLAGRPTISDPRARGPGFGPVPREMAPPNIRNPLVALSAMALHLLVRVMLPRETRGVKPALVL